MKRRRWSYFGSRSLARIVPLHYGLRHAGTLFFVFAALLVLSLSTIYPSGAGAFRSRVADALVPMISTVVKPIQGAAMFVRNVSGLSELQAENERLILENARLRDWYQTALSLEAENRSLRGLMNVQLEAHNTYISARVVGDSGATFLKSVLVSAGTDNGIRKSQAVISGDGLVGRVQEAGQRSARVLLITDVNSRVPVIVEDSSQHAILAGHNDDLPSLVHLPPDTEIKDGARIVTSGHGGIFPSGLPVGRVQRDESGAYRVNLFADFDRLIYVRMVERPEDANLLQETTDGSLD